LIDEVAGNDQKRERDDSRHSAQTRDHLVRRVHQAVGLGPAVGRRATIDVGVGVLKKP
jgi:hypothetical protein